MTRHVKPEPTFLDVMVAITNAKDLPEQKRRHWLSSLNGVTKAVDRPAETMLARLSAIWVTVMMAQKLESVSTWFGLKSLI